VPGLKKEGKGRKERKKKGKKHQHGHEINISCIQNNCYDSIPGWGSEYSLEGVGQVQVGMWLQLIVAPLDCMSVIVPVFQNIRLEGWRWIRGWSEVWRFGSKFGEVREAYQRYLSKAIFRLEKRRLYYMSFILQSKISKGSGQCHWRHRKVFSQGNFWKNLKSRPLLFRIFTIQKQ